MKLENNKYIKIGDKKFNLKFVYENSKEKKNLLIKSNNKISKSSQNIFQIFGIDDNLSRIHFSLGNVIKLKYGNEIKLVMMTFVDDLNKICDGTENLNFYCTNNNQNHFLKFFEGLLKFESDLQKKEYFLLGQRFGLIKLEINTLFINMLKNSGLPINKLFAIFEVPPSMLEILEYPSLTTIDLNEYKNTVNKSSDSFYMYSLPLNYKYDQNPKNYLKNYVLENLINYDVLGLCFGETTKKILNTEKEKDFLSYFDSCLEYGSVGSLMYSLNSKPEVLGINIGVYNDKNSFISFANKEVLNFLKNYMVSSVENVIFIQ